jgi:phosphoserine phosphatase RsbU/P
VDTIDLGIPLGLEDTIDAFSAEVKRTLQPGEGLVLYTDGITEAANTQHEL